ncbi:MAG: OmpH family outer membrane protein [Muribaculaceae bacterium]|nr:OmpH family outer membrane protein [Muribaculaceae bacterium]
MKRKLTTILPLLIAVVSLTGACSNDKKTPAPAAKKGSAPSEVTALPNYRYVDADTVLAKYNLSKDFEEEMIRMQSNLDNEAKRHETQVRSFQNSMQNKMQNNTYTEASYKADQQHLAQLGSNAEQALGKLQNNMQEHGMKAQKILNDSIQNFIKEYNAAHGYDAIFYKAATLYIDPRLDITDEVVEGLNARYNKVKK